MEQAHIVREQNEQLPVAELGNIDEGGQKQRDHAADRESDSLRQKRNGEIRYERSDVQHGLSIRPFHRAQVLGNNLRECRVLPCSTSFRYPRISKRFSDWL